MAVWINKAQLAEYLSVNKRSIDYMLKIGKLPQPVRISERIPLWDLNEVEVFMDEEKKRKSKIDKTKAKERAAREAKPRGRPVGSTKKDKPDDEPEPDVSELSDVDDEFILD